MVEKVRWPDVFAVDGDMSNEKGDNRVTKQDCGSTDEREQNEAQLEDRKMK